MGSATFSILPAATALQGRGPIAARWPKLRYWILHPGAHHVFTVRRRPLVEFRVHAARDAFRLEHLGECLAEVWGFRVIRDSTATLIEIDRSVVHELLAGPARRA